MTSPARRQIDLAMSEAQWQATVLDLALTLHWRALHHHDSRRQVGTDNNGKPILVGDKDAAGLPDWLFIRERHFFAELKAEGKQPTAKQLEIMDGLRKAGAEVHLWHPSDWPEVVIALTGRWHGSRGRVLELPPETPPRRTIPDVDHRRGDKGVSPVDTGGAT
ncbi:MAG TPA: hypothetical protein VG276_28130 [Actinomycetes bacterium]|jgi:hypothetical protein|nr:hypothetical protein [Actinomycetes bacterium]